MDVTETCKDPAYFHNALDVRREEEGLLPLRFSTRQLAVYGRREEYTVRALSPAGVALAFRTDSPRVEIAFSSPAGSRSWLYLDMYADGMLSGRRGWDTFTGKAEETVRFDIPAYVEKPCTVEVYLPHNRLIYIRRVEVADGSTLEPVPQPSSLLLCTGDSITQGMDARFPSSTYPVQLCRLLGASLLNQGVGGYVFAAESLDPDIGVSPETVTVAYGTNDWNLYGDAETFRAACRAYLRRLREIFPSSRILVFTPIWRADLGEDKPMGSFRRLCDIIRAETTEIGGTPVEGLHLAPHLPAYYGDGTVHPDDAGFLHYALNAAKHLLERR